MNSLVGANTGSFQSFGTQLFVLVRNQVNAEGKLVDICALSAEIEDANLQSCQRMKTRCIQMLTLTLGSGTPRLNLDFGYGCKANDQYSIY